MSTIKKGYTELHAVLLANADKKVSAIMDQLVPIMETKIADGVTRHAEDGCLEIFCYYHKQWERVDQVPYGKKANTVTGLNTMCKVGTNQWTKQLREYNQSADTILGLVEDGTITYEQIPEKRAEFAEHRKRIVPLEVSHWIEAHADERQQEAS